MVLEEVHGDFTACDVRTYSLFSEYMCDIYIYFYRYTRYLREGDALRINQNIEITLMKKTLTHTHTHTHARDVTCRFYENEWSDPQFHRTMHQLSIAVTLLELNVYLTMWVSICVYISIFIYFHKLIYAVFDTVYKMYSELRMWKDNDALIL